MLSNFQISTNVHLTQVRATQMQIVQTRMDHSFAHVGQVTLVMGELVKVRNKRI